VTDEPSPGNYRAVSGGASMRGDSSRVRKMCTVKRPRELIRAQLKSAPSIPESYDAPWPACLETGVNLEVTVQRAKPLRLRLAPEELSALSATAYSALIVVRRGDAKGCLKRSSAVQFKPSAMASRLASADHAAGGALGQGVSLGGKCGGNPRCLTREKPYKKAGFTRHFEGAWLRGPFP
jgi:hypothetical protein